jgi:hypothetical protein
MLFRNLLDQKTQAIKSEFDRFLKETMQNQTHPCDLLLIVVNGFNNPETVTWTNLNKPLSPYMIGPNTEGHSELLHQQSLETT